MKTLYTVYTRQSLEQSHGDYLHPVTSKGRFATPEEAETAAEIIRKAGAWASVGKFYLFTRDEWSRDQYRDRLPMNRTATEKTDCTIIAGDKGTTLVFRGLHFEIL